MIPFVSINDALNADGFTVSPGALGRSTREWLEQELKPLIAAHPGAGLRDLASNSPAVANIAQSETVRDLAETVLGPRARLVRSILFNKSTDTNWQVPWHQDLTIALRNEASLEGFSGWSVKNGVVHVQPPIEILERMVTIRLHLDPADSTNGALWLSPGSHRLGRIPAGHAASAAERQGMHLCEADAGDALLFRPLTLHASRKATSDHPRRVIQLEFAGTDLPDPLEWAEALG